jgi:hypothetical protein
MDRDMQMRLSRKMRDIVEQDSPKVGYELRNGAVCIDHAQIGKDERSVQFVVLAVTSGHQPYVTWTYDIGVTETATGDFDRVGPAAFSGHYHTKLTDAVAEFQARSGRETQKED